MRKWTLIACLFLCGCPSPEHSHDFGTHGEPRDPRWQTASRHYIEKCGECVACGSTKELVTHHVIPLHIAPAKEMDEDNWICLCHDCHFWIGHLKNYRSWNEHVREDARAYRKRIDNRP